MSNIVIKAENISKAYQIGEFSTGTLSNDIERWWTLLRGKEDPYLKIGEVNDRATKGESNVVWSLKDINFEIQRGDAVGIIGKNGAGKSTLLKLLSRVTSPTNGSIKVKGKIASLLEVGTGFHPELTGRENIYLNGAILGMRRNEITRKFEEIADFSGVERYIDTPVKRYSSGMYVRLAFAVAAYLESEILIVDEVLAVGDAEFQKKCLGKMNDVSKNEGRTVLFVSHSMGSIAQLCNNCIVLDRGKIIIQSNVNEAIDKYLSIGQNEKLSVFIHKESNKAKDAFIAKMRMISNDGNNTNLISHEHKILIEIDIHINKWDDNLELGLSLQDINKKRIFTIHRRLNEFIKEGEIIKRILIEIPENIIVPGKFSWITAIHIPGNDLIDVNWDICAFSIVDTGSEFAKYENSDYGYFFLNNYSIKTIV